MLDRVTALTPPAPQKALSFGYTRDTTLQRWITTVTMAGGGSYTYREDTKGRTHEVVNPFNNQTFRLEYDRDGKNILTVHPNQVREESTYTERDWLGGTQSKRANGTVLDTFNYLYTDAAGVYDPTGHLRQVIDGSGTRAFTYNNLYELESESHPTTGTITYSYDLNGNRRSRNVNGAVDWYGIGAGTGACPYAVRSPPA